ncbi:unnamed protein product [Danaus chrysippus]|uniref:(African queen) hypothetical protein n=1 Tax=Danaus chrysippus TaxID=151541 RepID=A0A8J2W242_9NEOP|nr:unnamed protein product [Danaus chrysippus]
MCHNRDVASINVTMWVGGSFEFNERSQVGYYLDDYRRVLISSCSSFDVGGDAPDGRVSSCVVIKRWLRVACAGAQCGSIE